jgi:SAM-dependent MidA family methyltransferase
MWEELGRPDRLTVVEAGAGRGDLAAEALGAGDLGDRLRWVIVEQFAAVEARQRERLRPWEGSVTWVGDVGAAAPAVGCILANEVLDNQPVHVLERVGGEPMEIYVGLGGGDLIEVPGPVSDPALTARAAPAVTCLEDGDRFEVSLDAERWVGDAAAALERGWIIAIDYGDEEPDLWRGRPAGSLVTYRAEGLGLDPLSDPGSADITAHVNFSALARAVSAAGLVPQALITQRAWLQGLGIDAVADQLRAAQDEAQRAGDHAEMVRLLADRGRLGALTARGGLGDLRVFIAAKDAPPLK